MQKAQKISAENGGKMKINGAIFDFDGTIMDSMYVWENVASDYLINRGLQPRAGLREKFKTLSIYQAASYYREEYAIKDSVETIVNDVNAIVEHAYFYDVLPKDGVREFLTMLAGKNVAMCIATATDKYLVEAALERCALSDYFKAVFTCSDIGKGKDSPDIYFASLGEINTKKEETVIFEDAYYAAATAKKAGFYVAGIYDKYERNVAMLTNNSDIYFNSFIEATEVFK